MPDRWELELARLTTSDKKVKHTDSTSVHPIAYTSHDTSDNHMRNAVGTALQRSPDAENDTAQDTVSSSNLLTDKQGQESTKEAALDGLELPDMERTVHTIS